MDPKTLLGPGLNVSLYPAFLDPVQADAAYQELAALFTGKPSWRRANLTYGDLGVSYTIRFTDGVAHRIAIGWTPLLATIRDRITALTGQQYNVCVVQWYPWGRVDIKPHRDKEMTPGTTICGVSLGATRDLALARGGTTHTLPLPHGSLYLFSPPTNDYWSHSIVRDDTVKEPRISLTFRNYVTGKNAVACENERR